MTPRCGSRRIRRLPPCHRSHRAWSVRVSTRGHPIGSRLSSRRRHSYVNRVRCHNCVCRVCRFSLRRCLTVRMAARGMHPHCRRASRFGHGPSRDRQPCRGRPGGFPVDDEDIGSGVWAQNGALHHHWLGLPLDLMHLGGAVVRCCGSGNCQGELGGRHPGVLAGPRRVGSVSDVAGRVVSDRRAVVG